MNSNTKKIYKIGMAAYLLADYLSDYGLKNVLREMDFGKYIERLREINPELKMVAGVMLSIAEVEARTSQYIKKVEGQAKGEDFRQIQNQFAMSSDVLDNWLDVMHQVTPAKYEELNSLIEQAVATVNGKRKSDIDLLLDWVALYPEGYAMSLETVRNKAIYIKNL